MNMENVFVEVLPFCVDNNNSPSYNISSDSDIHTVISCLMICVISNNCRCAHVQGNTGNIPNNTDSTHSMTCERQWSIKDHCSELQRTPGVHYVMLRRSSCAVVKMFQPLALDGEYWLQFADGVAQVYCHGMNSSHPRVSSYNRAGCRWIGWIVGWCVEG